MKIVREHIEYMRMFHEDSDPIDDMRIGAKDLIKNWLEKHNIHDYFLNSNLTIDTYNTVVLTEKELTEFPSYIKFNHIAGGFHCNINKLTSLLNGPRSVSGSFICSYNNLTTLENGPIIVNESYAASNNKLETLKGLPKEIQGSLFLNGNNLKTLEFMPNEIHGDLYIFDNPLESVEFFPTKVFGDVHFSIYRDVITYRKIKEVSQITGNIISYK